MGNQIEMAGNEVVSGVFSPGEAPAGPVMLPPRLFLASLLGFTVLAGGAASAEDANQSLKAVPDTKPPPTKLISQSVTANDPWRRGSTTVAINLGAGSAVGFLGMTFSYH